MKRLALAFFAATLVGLYFSSQFYVNFAPDEPRIWSRALAVNLTYYYLWAAFLPVVIWAARKFRIEASRWMAPLLIHLVLSAALTLLQIVIAESTLAWLSPSVRDKDVFAAVLYGLKRNFHSSLPTYWLILAGYYAVDYYAKYRDRELRASQLAARLSAAQLEALKMQLNPHFLFNTLNSISSLMYSNLEAADAMMARLADFLRLTLENEGVQEIPLRQELEFLERYLEIERVRFEERLTVEMQIEDAALDAKVPNLSLQPLIENAIHHGIARLPRGGRITVSARRDRSMLRIAVRNDLPAAETLGPEAFREGVGLANTRARLEQLYGLNHELTLEREESGRLLVNLTIPFATA